MEAAVLVEGDRLLVDGVDGYVSAPDLVAGCHRPAEGVEEQLGAEPLAVQLPVEGQPSQQQRRDPVWVAAAQAAGQVGPLDHVRAQGEISDHDQVIGSVPDVGAALPFGVGGSSMVAEPPVERRLAGIEP